MDLTGGIPYTSALNPTQCEEMHKFLVTVSKYGKKAAQKGIKPNLTMFIKEWRGNKASDAEKEYKRRYYEKRKLKPSQPTLAPQKPTQNEPEWVSR